MTSQPIHVLVGIVFRNAAATIANAVDSVLAQAATDARVSLLLVDDSSTDDWRGAIGARLLAPGVHARRVDLQSIALARNFVLDEVQRAFPDVDYVARLDADDVIAGPNVFRDLSAILERERPDALLAGNLQRLDDVILPRPNLATNELLEHERLVARLARMASGEPAAELPSCNTVVRRGLPLRYPVVTSAEDHWFTVSLLVARPRWRVVVAPELLYAIYRLHGTTTQRNQATPAYLASRRALLDAARRMSIMEGSHGAS